MRLINPQVSADIAAGKPLRLDLGAGPRPRSGCYSLDQFDLPAIDVVADLNQPFDQLPDNCAEYVFSSHALEHVEHLLPLLGELHRITRPDGLIEIVVPHFSNPYYYSDPTHRRFFGLYTMNYFVPTELQPSARTVPNFYSQTRFRLEAIKLYFYRTSFVDRIFVPIFRYFVNRSPAAQDFYERRLSWIFPAAEIRYKLRPLKSA
jgi:SAM-dependent methyltransferase